MSIDPRDLEARVIEAVPDPLARIQPKDIGPLFGKSPSWFRNCKRQLEHDGFPRPMARGFYLRRDVVRFMFARTYGLSIEDLPPAAALPTRGPDPYDLYVEHLSHRRRKRALP